MQRDRRTIRGQESGVRNQQPATGHAPTVRLSTLRLPTPPRELYQIPWPDFQRVAFGARKSRRRRFCANHQERKGAQGVLGDLGPPVAPALNADPNQHLSDGSAAGSIALSSDNLRAKANYPKKTTRPPVDSISGRCKNAVNSKINCWRVCDDRVFSLYTRDQRGS
jgi:hypothetical protein